MPMGRFKNKNFVMLSNQILKRLSTDSLFIVFKNPIIKH